MPLTHPFHAGEAEARKDSTIAEATAEEQRMEAKLKNDTDIAESKRDYELNKAAYDTEVCDGLSFRSHSWKV